MACLPLLPRREPIRWPLLDQARRFVEAGAILLDVGGESTRPGSQPLGIDEERQRVIPIIKALAKEFPGSLISVDTYKAAVAEEALDAGVHIVNDVWGLPPTRNCGTSWRAAAAP